MTPAKSDFIKYFLSEGYKESAAVKAWDFYNNRNWVDSNNKEVKNWKSKVKKVWFTEENKISSLPDFNNKEKEILEIISGVNELVRYPYDPTIIGKWAKTICELIPNVSAFIIKKAIDNYKMDKVTWDNNAGVQNIFREYKRIYLDFKEEEKLKLFYAGSK